MHFTASMDDLADCQLVVEAVPEHLDLKKEIFGKLDAIVGARRDPRHQHLVAARSPRSPSPRATPSASSGMHFFNPAPVLQFVEVIRTVVTEDEVFEDVKALAAAARQAAGHRRRQGRLHRQRAALRLPQPRGLDVRVASTPSREDIDAAMRLGCGYPMGPLALMDLIGLDTAYEILDTMYKQGRDRLHAPSPIIKQMVSAGLKGRKSGRGFYTYAEPGSSQVVDDALTPRRRRRVRRRRCAGPHGRRRRLGHDGDRHHRGLRQGRLRRHLRGAQPAQGRRRHRRRSASRSRRPSSAASSPRRPATRRSAT